MPCCSATLPELAGQPALYTSLARDVVAHEVTHAILDGLRPRLTEPGLPDQPAFHEALADIVALLSVFDNEELVAQLLQESDGLVSSTYTDPNVLKRTPLLGLAEQLGARLSNERGQALRRSVELRPSPDWQNDETYADPHRLGEVLVAAVTQTLVQMWSNRIKVFRSKYGLDASRVAEEGAKAARHLLGMTLRSLDYLPPVELEFGDVIDAILTADERLTQKIPTTIDVPCASRSPSSD